MEEDDLEAFQSVLAHELAAVSEADGLRLATRRPDAVGEHEQAVVRLPGDRLGRQLCVRLVSKRSG